MLIDIATVFLGILLAQVAPGPNLMAVSAAALGSGRAAGLAVAAGVASGVVIWAVLFAFGIGALLQAFPETLTLMRFLGGGYLIYMGTRALWAAYTHGARAPAAARAILSPPSAYRRGLLVVMTNPKAALMWVAVSMFLASSGLSGPLFLLIGLGAAVSAMLIYGAYALVFSTGLAIRTYGRFFRVIEASFGAVFGFVGAKLVMDGLRDLRS